LNCLRLLTNINCPDSSVTALEDWWRRGEELRNMEREMGRERESGRMT
jgi:hypothetical protein